MSNLFYAGQRKTKKGTMTITMRKDTTVKKLQKLRDGGEVAIKRTVSDFASRGPGWVSKGIRQHYGVDKAAIEDAQKRPKRGGTSIRVSGISVDSATLEYKGRTLTPIHFKMSPATINPKGLTQKRELRIPGQRVNFEGAAGGPVGTVRAPNPYTVKATIIKGKRSKMEAGTYLASSSKDNGDAPILPFQRVGDGRKPVHAVRTVSVPQMIDGRAHDTIEEIISENLKKRFDNHIKQAMK